MAPSPNKYLLVSMPLDAFDTGDKGEALGSLKETVGSDNGAVVPLQIPDFKIGPLGALLQQADDLNKLESSSEAVVAKVGDSLKVLLDNDENKIAEYKTVNDSTC
jgi:V-type H+-transporting ATPase subunit C